MSLAVQIDLKDASSFPSRRIETWKYSDLRRYLRDAPQPSGTAVVDRPGPFDALGGEAIVLANGRPVGATDFIASGRQTLRLRYISDADGTGHTASARISARESAQLLILESHEGRGGAYVAHNRLDIDVAPGAEVTRLVLVEEPEQAISVMNADVRLAPGGRYRQTVVATGAKLQRIETQVLHGGQGADARIDGLYLLDGARGVFQGKIVVRRGADGTDARMSHHALIASDRAEIDAKPELIIYADDVQCAHGNTIGALDEQALFYMQQRGLPADEARALLTQAFLIEVVDRIEVEDAREVVREWLTARL
jgi:Fe-S cluster assembly protein SufD